MRKYFGEIARYPTHSEEEKEEAKKYLELWKKFLLRRLSRDSFNVMVVDEQWGIREAYLDGSLAQNENMYLKLCLESDFNYELK
jgi:hypothetical protein